MELLYPLAHLLPSLLCLSKSYLSEGGEETFTHASTLCVARIAPLAGITLPMDVDTQASPRHMVAALDALPTSLLHPTQVSTPSVQCNGLATRLGPRDM